MGEGSCAEKFLRLLDLYGRWPKEVIVDGAEWWATAISRIPKIRRVEMKGEIRNMIEGFFGEFLKRRIKDFDRYFPSWDRELRSVKRWLGVFGWYHNQTRQGGLLMLI